MDGVVSGVFLILESGLHNDGKRKAKAGGESSGAKMRTSLTQTSLPTLPASAAARMHRPHRKATVGGPRAGEAPQSRLTRAWGGFAGSGEGEGRQGPA